MKRIIAGVLGISGICFVLAAGAPAAIASTSPPTRMQAQPFGWTGMSVKPAHIYFGQGGAPFITGLHWSYWKEGASAASGTLHQLASPGCYPSYKCRWVSEAATVDLSAVKTHGTLHYFSGMTVRFKHSGRTYRLGGTFKPSPGQSGPSWIFPTTWPYL